MTRSHAAAGLPRQICSALLCAAALCSTGCRDVLENQSAVEYRFGVVQKLSLPPGRHAHLPPFIEVRPYPAGIVPYSLTYTHLVSEGQPLLFRISVRTEIFDYSKLAPIVGFAHPQPASEVLDRFFRNWLNSEEPERFLKLRAKRQPEELYEELNAALLQRVQPELKRVGVVVKSLRVARFNIAAEDSPTGSSDS